MTSELINPLRNERVIVRFLGRKSGIWGDNPKHVLAGGMAENSVRTFVVPLLSIRRIITFGVMLILMELIRLH